MVLEWLKAICGRAKCWPSRRWHSRGQRFDPAYLHQKHSVSFEIECFSILFSLFCAGHFRLGQQMDNRPSQFLLSYCGKEVVMVYFRYWRGKKKGRYFGTLPSCVLAFLCYTILATQSNSFQHQGWGCCKILFCSSPIASP